MSKFRVWGFAIIIVVLSGTFFLIGTLSVQPEIETRIVTVREPVIQEVPVYVEKVVHEPRWIFEEVPVYIEKTEYIEVPAKLKSFQSSRELQVWLANNFIKDAVLGECVDTALELCQRAWQDGYQMSTELWGDGQREGHMICSTVIGDKIYFMEPSSTFSWLAGIKKSVAGN